jgi:hypothetical protein
LPAERPGVVLVEHVGGRRHGDERVVVRFERGRFDVRLVGVRVVLFRFQRRDGDDMTWRMDRS